MALGAGVRLLPATAFAEETPDTEPEVAVTEDTTVKEEETQLASPR